MASSGTIAPTRFTLYPGWLAAALLCGGCTSLLPGKSEDAEKEARMRELMTVPEVPDLIREAAVSHGIRAIEVDGVGAVNGLAGTGGPPDPSPDRDQLLEEMKRHDVADPNRFLEMDSTALVRVRATIPAGARRGDPIDLRVLAPNESRATDLHNGWLLETRLRQRQVLQNMVRQSEVLAIGIGSVITRGDFTPGSDASLKTEGIVLRGGRVQETRKLGLILRPKFQHAKLADSLAQEINRRFFFFDGTTRRGIAKPREDDFIEIDVHPRYRDNIPRLMEVTRSISGRSDSSRTRLRLADLARRLQEPATAAAAALELEAMGESAVPTLLAGLASPNPELRFYAAEALAYLDRVESIDPLGQAVREVPAFRHPALLALQGVEHPAAIEALERLMNQLSIETRYGSFCAIRRRADGEGTLRAKRLPSFWLYEVPSEAPPTIVMSLREKAEIVLFGSVTPIEIPEFLMGPGGLMLKPDPSDPAKLRISRFQPGKDDQRAIVGSDIASVVQGIVAVGGGYGDVMTVLRTAKDSGYLADQLAIDPLPRAMRTYYRDEQDPASEDKVEQETTKTAPMT